MQHAVGGEEHGVNHARTAAPTKLNQPPTLDLVDAHEPVPPRRVLVGHPRDGTTRVEDLDGRRRSLAAAAVIVAAGTSDPRRLSHLRLPVAARDRARERAVHVAHRVRPIPVPRPRRRRRTAARGLHLVERLGDSALHHRHGDDFQLNGSFLRELVQRPVHARVRGAHDLALGLLLDRGVLVREHVQCGRRQVQGRDGESEPHLRSFDGEHLLEPRERGERLLLGALRGIHLEVNLAQRALDHARRVRAVGLGVDALVHQDVHGVSEDVVEGVFPLLVAHLHLARLQDEPGHHLLVRAAERLQ